jgi:hypothetical protein
MSNPVVIFKGEVFWTNKGCVSAQRDVTLEEFVNMHLMDITARRKGKKSPLSPAAQEVLSKVSYERMLEEQVMIMNARAK